MHPSASSAWEAEMRTGRSIANKRRNLFILFNLNVRKESRVQKCCIGSFGRIKVTARRPDAYESGVEEQAITRWCLSRSNGVYRPATGSDSTANLKKISGTSHPGLVGRLPVSNSSAWLHRLPYSICKTDYCLIKATSGFVIC